MEKIVFSIQIRQKEYIFVPSLKQTFNHKILKMKKATLVVSKPYLNNKIFDREDKILNRDDCLGSFVFLKDEFSKCDIQLATQDIHPVSESEIVIYNDMPKTLPSLDMKGRSFLLILESPLIIKNSLERQRHQYFKKVFTWNDELVDGKKYIKINYNFELPREIDKLIPRSNFCTLISAHKRSRESNELYSERIKGIRWFEKNAPKDFDLYGINWDRPAHLGLMKLFKKLPILERMLPFEPFPSYKGRVVSKNEVLKNYTFAICYENIADVPGYITEKIFDCFFAGTIPIYRGASNITNYVPYDCFIDQRNFSSYEELYIYLKSLNENDIRSYLNRIENFLQSEQAQAFHVRHFAQTIVKEVLK